MKFRQAWLCIKENSKELFFRTALMRLREAHLCKKQFSRLYFFFAHWPYEIQTSLALQQNIFSGSKELFFPHCSHETQTSPALQKIIFQALFFFSHALVKSANSTSLPRLSPLHTVQMH